MQQEGVNADEAGPSGLDRNIAREMATETLITGKPAKRVVRFKTNFTPVVQV